VLETVEKLLCDDTVEAAL